MSYKSENWKEKLAEVRSYGTFTEHKDGSVEKSADDIINDQIEEELKSLLEEPASPDEAEMAHTQLEFIEYAANEVEEYLKTGVDFPEWLQNKLTKAHEVMKDIHAQMEGDKAKKDEYEEQKEETIDEESMEDKIKKLFKISDKKATLGIANLMNMTDVKVLQDMQKQNPKGFERMAKKMGELPSMEEVEVEESVEKTVLKLTEKNMLGRLAKQLRLNEQGKQQMFAYFEKGELKQ